MWEGTFSDAEAHLFERVKVFKSKVFTVSFKEKSELKK